MQQFIEKYDDQTLGVVSGFDRLVFRGDRSASLTFGYWDAKRRVQVARGMEEYLWQNKRRAPSKRYGTQKDYG